MCSSTNARSRWRSASAFGEYSKSTSVGEDDPRASGVGVQFPRQLLEIFHPADRPTRPVDHCSTCFPGGACCTSSRSERYSTLPTADFGRLERSSIWHGVLKLARLCAQCARK